MDTHQDQPEQLALFLAHRDMPCPGCGYNLRGLRGASCPECTQQLHLQVGLVEPRLGSFLAGVIALSLGLGLSTLLVLYWVIRLLIGNSMGGAPTAFLVVTGIGSVIFSAALGGFLKGRSRFRRLSRTARVGLVMGCVLLTLAYLVIFAVVVQ